MGTRARKKKERRKKGNEGEKKREMSRDANKRDVEARCVQGQGQRWGTTTFLQKHT